MVFRRQRLRLRRPILVANISAYLRYGDDSLAAPKFFNLLVQRTGYGELLDVNHLVERRGWR